MPKLPDMKVLDEPLHEDDHEWVRDNAAVYLERIEQALAAGATPESIYQHYMKKAPHRYPFWLRLKHAACFLQRQNGGG